MNEMRKLIEAIETLEESGEVTPKQVYEWVKTGHWSRAQFEAWLSNYTEAEARKAFNDGYSEGQREMSDIHDQWVSDHMDNSYQDGYDDGRRDSIDY
jgi:hypothetical protein